MIDDLLKAQKISPKEFKIYSLFASELGHECLSIMMDEAFMEEPLESEFTGVRFAFYDGRRSMLRSIRTVVEKVNTIIKDNNYVRPEQPEQQQPEPKPKRKR